MDFYDGQLRHCYTPGMRAALDASAIPCSSDRCCGDPQVYTNESYGTTVYVGSYDYKVRMESCITSTRTSGPPVSSHSRTNLFVQVYALDAATGQQKWSFKTVGSVIASPTVVETSLGPRM